VGPLGVVVAQIAFQVEAEAGLLGDEIAGEGGLPALVQDGLLDSLHAPVGPSLDPPMRWSVEDWVIRKRAL
jgi:hypothetical protein